MRVARTGAALTLLMTFCQPAAAVEKKNNSITGDKIDKTVINDNYSCMQCTMHALGRCEIVVH